MGRNILKCALAYLLGSLATFIPSIRSWLGSGDGKHVVATVVVYFHPARSAGSMLEATVLALAAFAYAAVVAGGSMGVARGFEGLSYLGWGYVVILLLFVGGGLGLVGWVKQRMGRALVNVVSFVWCQ